MEKIVAIDRSENVCKIALQTPKKLRTAGLVVSKVIILILTQRISDYAALRQLIALHT